ncbi:DUF3291 domain-containing protein [Streptomyces sp. BE147]|uniref:DUF3291 domain-containing protein n=1 Tax=unclassified Streptomyces TaxID=2593676 RepID=UPI002E7AAB74|nr:DUF3291 domain-containing protein [Streptomyces sp. BE147]MEE1735309.1 DUF3291 domain-containing protein [Streptomyces sp. BE147]
MPTLPWATPNPAPPHTRAYVMASRFTLGSRRDVPRFFLKSLQAWRQVRSAPGAFGASLVAHPLAGVFLTLSAWENRDALYVFAGTEPHRSIMDAVRPTMRAATFTFWEVSTDDLPLTWDDARRRLDAQAHADAAQGPATAADG